MKIARMMIGLLGGGLLLGPLAAQEARESQPRQFSFIDPNPVYEQETTTVREYRYVEPHQRGERDGAQLNGQVHYNGRETRRSERRPEPIVPVIEPSIWGEVQPGERFRLRALEEPDGALYLQDARIEPLDAPRGESPARVRVQVPEEERLAPRPPTDAEARVQLSGRITRLGSIDHQGLLGQLIVAEVEREDGRRHVVDLGPERLLRQLPLVVGRQIEVLAVPGRVGMQAGLVAQQLRIDGRLIRIGETARDEQPR